MRFGALSVVPLFLAPIIYSSPIAIPRLAVAPRSATYSVVQVNGGHATTSATETITTTIYTTIISTEASTTTITPTPQPVVVILETETLVHTSSVIKVPADVTVVVTTTVAIYGDPSPKLSSTGVATFSSGSIPTSALTTTLATAQILVTETITYTARPTSVQAISTITTANVTTVLDASRAPHASTTVQLSEYVTVVTVIKPAQTVVETILFEDSGGSISAIPTTTILSATTMISTQILTLIQLPMSTDMPELPPLMISTTRH